MAAETKSPPTTLTLKQPQPGYLLAPFGWAAEQVAVMAQAEPALLAHLLELDCKRMHLVALVLAHGERRPGGRDCAAEGSAAAPAG